MRLRCDGEGEWDAVLDRRGVRLEPVTGPEGDALLAADAVTWRRIASDVGGGMEASRGPPGDPAQPPPRAGLPGRHQRASGPEPPGAQARAHARGRPVDDEAGEGEAVVLIHGLGATKASLLPTLRALAPSFRVIALDLPGFGDSVKPIGKRYDPPFFAGGVVALLDGSDSTARTSSATASAAAWPWRWACSIPTAPPGSRCCVPRWPGCGVRVDAAAAPAAARARPHPARAASRGRAARALVIPGAQETWIAVAVDEFLRLYFDPRGRAALYAAARQIRLEEPGRPASGRACGRWVPTRSSSGAAGPPGPGRLRRARARGAAARSPPDARLRPRAPARGPARTHAAVRDLPQARAPLLSPG